MKLFYDPRDNNKRNERRGEILYWLDDLGALPLNEAQLDDQGFLFAGFRGMQDFKELVEPYHCLRDSPQERESLIFLDKILAAIKQAGASVPTPKSWFLQLDDPLPPDLSFPLFVRTAQTSWKLGGKISCVQNVEELQDEAEQLRRVFGWDATIVARQWLELAVAGECLYGPIPQEVRVWIVDNVPYAWSFHHLLAVKEPAGFPLAKQDLDVLLEFSLKIAAVFTSRLIVADFAKLEKGDWVFIEAGPGSCAGTAHEGVFKAVASKLVGKEYEFDSDWWGGKFA